MGLLNFICATIAAIIINIIASDLYDRCPSISRRLIGWSVNLLPETKREHYAEEWLSHLSDSQTKLDQVRHAVGCFVGALKLRWRDNRELPAAQRQQLELQAAYDALAKTAQLRDSFVHHVSYELRSPLTNIIGFTQLLGDESVGALNQRQREYAEHIMRSSGALLVMINDILDLASIDAGSLELQREVVDVRETIDAAIRGIEDRVAEAHLSIVLDVSPNIGSVYADGKRVRQILFNLLSNSVGFSLPGDRIEVIARRDGHDLVLSVRDHGIGMPAEVAALAFDRFESRTLGARHRGVGLGLSIVRSFVELHGGRVELETAPRQGTCVTCRLPLRQ